MKIIIVVPAIRKIGGITTSLINMLNNINLDNDNVSLCVMANNLNDNKILPEKVTIVKAPLLIELAKTNKKELFGNKYSIIRKIQLLIIKLMVKLLGLNHFIRFTSFITKLKEEYDVAISYSNDIPAYNYIEGSNDFVKYCVKAKRKIAWIHSDPYKLGFSYRICEKTYEEFDVIVNVSYACKKIFDEIIPKYEYKSKVVYNMLNYNQIYEKANEQSPYDSNYFNIVTVARLDNRTKRIDRVVECCEYLKHDGFNNFRWYIVGDGPDMKLLQQMVREKSVQDVVLFVGRKENPYPYIKNADILVMTSDFEAHSMVLLESLALGTPIICTSYPSAKEIVINGVNGFLVEKDSYAIYNLIKQLITDRAIVQKLRLNIDKTEKNNEISLRQFYEVVYGTDK